MPAAFLVRMFLLATALCAALPVAAQRLPGLDKAPAPWKAYFDAARKADAIAQPLERCLAHPDFPGNAWAAGLAQAYCHSLHGKNLSLSDIDGYLARGQQAQLDVALRAELAAHSAAQHSEAIHRTLAQFTSSPSAERLSARWLEAAPGSPFALAARAQYLLNLAWDGAAGTPGRDAATLLERALAIEPALVAAHAMLLEAAMLAGDQDKVRAAWTRGQAVDAGCRELARVRMVSLRPRRGGSIEAMDAFAASLLPLAARRPLLHNVAAMASLERADSFARRAQFAPAAGILRSAVRTSTYPDLWWRLASMLGELDNTERHELLAILIDGGRFADDDRNTAFERARQLREVGETAWALRALEQALALAPDNLETRQLLGAAYVDAGQPERAEPHFVAALASPELRPLTLRALVAAMGSSAHADRAAGYAETLTREQPDSKHGWSVLGNARFKLQDMAGARAAYERFLRTDARSDPAWSKTVALAERRLAELAGAQAR